jgi:cardiolipin synthase
VRVLLDTFNSKGGTGKDSIDLMRKAGVTVYLLDHPFGRTVMEIQHRKLTIVDGDTAYVGGQNLDYAGHNAHDATLKVRGPIVANLHQLSVDLWRQAGAPPLPDPPMPHPSSVGDTVLRPLVTDPCDHAFKEALFAAIDAAKHHIYLDQVFFSDNDVIARLGEAVKRGVTVELVIPQKSYSKEINAVNRVDLPRLVKMGLHVRLNPAETHMKTVTIDGNWAVLGSTNLDGRALNDNYELSLAISNPATVQELDRRILLPTILSSPLATPESLALPNRPWTAALKDRLLGWGRRFF